MPEDDQTTQPPASECADLLGPDGRKIAFLIGSIYFYGDFVAETINERQLETLLRKHGFFFSDIEQQLEASQEFDCTRCDGDGFLGGASDRKGGEMQCPDCCHGQVLA